LRSSCTIWRLLLSVGTVYTLNGSILYIEPNVNVLTKAFILIVPLRNNPPCVDMLELVLSVAFDLAVLTALADRLALVLIASGLPIVTDCADSVADVDKLAEPNDTLIALAVSVAALPFRTVPRLVTSASTLELSALSSVALARLVTSPSTDIVPRLAFRTVPRLVTNPSTVNASCVERSALRLLVLRPLAVRVFCVDRLAEAFLVTNPSAVNDSADDIVALPARIN